MNNMTELIPLLTNTPEHKHLIAVITEHQQLQLENQLKELIIGMQNLPNLSFYHYLTSTLEEAQAVFSNNFVVGFVWKVSVEKANGEYMAHVIVYTNGMGRFGPWKRLSSGDRAPSAHQALRNLLEDLRGMLSEVICKYR